MATDTITDDECWMLTRDQLSWLSDRLYSRSLSTLDTITPAERRDLLNASRAITRLLQSYERAAGHSLTAVMLGGC